MKLQSAIISGFAALLCAGVAFGQGTGTGMPPAGGGTGTGGGMNPGSGAPGAGGQHPTDLDLPVAKPEYQGAPIEEEPPIPPEIEPPTEAPPTFFGEEIDSENDTIFYVLDISGSMGWDNQSYTRPDGTQASGPRIDRAKAELIRSIQGLSENFKFNIIAYDCGTRQWQGSMQEANDANKAAATAWVSGHRPTGATGTGPAAASALGDKDNMAVVLLTDGAPNCGASGNSGHRSMIANANTQGATVNVFGIAASGSYRSFCQGVASDNGGSYVDVP